MTKSDQTAAVVEAVIKDFGKVDHLVNNAGITRDNLFMRMKEEEWDAVMAVNLKGVFNLTRAVVRPMIAARYGRIVNLVLDRRADGQRRPDQLRGLQGRAHRVEQVAGPRDRPRAT